VSAYSAPTDTGVGPGSWGGVEVYFTDRGIEELEDRRGNEQLSIDWLAARMRNFVDEHPEFEDAVERLATFLARDDADEPGDLQADEAG
jgi:Family of unknown function (DUF6104)